MSKPGPRGQTSEISDRLQVLLTDPLAELGLDLEGVDLAAAGKRRVLRVAVDKDGGVSLDDIAEATRAVSRTLDDADAMGERPYTLEVSSPGVDRPLTLPRHWRRNAGRLVEVALRAPADPSTLTGRILEAGPDAAVVDVDGQRHSVRYDDVTKARVQIEFGSGRGGTSGTREA